MINLSFLFVPLGGRLVLIVMSALLVNVPKLISWGSEKHGCRSQDAWLDIVPGLRKPIKFFWASLTLLASLGVLYVSVSSYYGRHFCSLISSEFVIPFLPQGVTLSFYGIAGLFLSLHWWVLIFLNVGGGYNFFDKKNRMVCFFRYGFPGKYRRIFLQVRMEDIQSLILHNPDPSSGVLYMQTREQGTIPLTPVDDYYDRTPRNVIQKAWDLSRFLSVPMEIVPYA
uniref:photosystem I assembly protein Ycf4 n=1 Tax=Medicago turbinata TaxID=70980 RepID=UPI00226D3EF5|nr:photosystem I assembly protein Ycf4 [Medicago turbinata]UZC30458.1 photosystem I assembly protein Ycf4 [Medicago turbinata]